MDVLNIELFSIIILLILLSDYFYKFKNYITKSSYVWLFLTLSTIILAICSITLSYSSNQSLNLITMIVYIFTNLVASLCAYFYISYKFLSNESDIKVSSNKIVVLLLLFFIFTISYYFLIMDINNVTPILHEYKNIVLITIVPIFLVMVEYISKGIKKNIKTNYKIIYALLIVITGIIVDVPIPNVNFISISYSLFALIIYISKHDTVINTDELTGLYNKRVLESFAQSHHINSKIALFNIDIDSFKQINDTYGHLTGDIIIKDVAKIIRNSIRETDYAIRNGGDEFILIAYIRRDIDKEAILKKINNNIKNYNKTSNIKVSLSIGNDVMVINQFTTAVDFKTKLEEIDQKMYIAKQKKKSHQKK